MNQDSTCQQLVYYAIKAYQRGLVRGSGGNISARLNPGQLMVITASGISLGETNLDNLVTLNIETRDWIPNGNLRPSKESWHIDIMKLRPDVGAIVHVHPPYAVAFTVKGMEIPMLTDAGFKQKPIPRIPYFPGGSDNLKEKIIETIHQNPDCQTIILEKHGIITMAPDVASAYNLADLIEELAIVAYLSKNL